MCVITVCRAAGGATEATEIPEPNAEQQTCIVGQFRVNFADIMRECNIDQESDVSIIAVGS